MTTNDTFENGARTGLRKEHIDAFLEHLYQAGYAKRRCVKSDGYLTCWPDGCEARKSLWSISMNPTLRHSSCIPLGRERLTPASSLPFRSTYLPIFVPNLWCNCLCRSQSQKLIKSNAGTLSTFARIAASRRDR